MSRWAYRVEKVTVGENSQKVRQLTAGERKEFAKVSKQIKAGEREKDELPALLAGFGCTEPTLTPEEIAQMPADLLDACIEKIMDLTGTPGLKEDSEKKAPALVYRTLDQEAPQPVPEPVLAQEADPSPNS